MKIKNKRRSLLFVIPTLTMGGAQKVIATLLRHLSRNRFNLSLAVVDTRKAAFLNDIPKDVNFIDLNCRRVRYAVIKLFMLIRKMQPDVVFSTLGHLNLAIAILRPLLPNHIQYIVRETIVVSHGLHRFKFPSLWSLAYRCFYKNHNQIVCQSIDMQADLINNFKLAKNRTILINNPVDTEYIRAKINEVVDFSGMIKDLPKLKLVAAGRLVYQKGFDLLIEAIAFLDKPDIHLTILGDGPLKNKLVAIVKQKGLSKKVVFAGFQSNPYAWFARSDAFVLSSRYEGFPNVVLEALACGTPVIATPAPGGTYEILKKIPGCTIADFVSAKALAQAIQHWIGGKRERILNSFIEQYSVGIIVKKYEKILSAT
jgi:glycosyltransferase involved in cell wall biosynthesis